MKGIGEPYEGKPHVRFDEGEQGRPAGRRRLDLLRHSVGNAEPTGLGRAYRRWAVTKPVPYSAL